MTQQNEPIAIVGMGCRFPGASSTPSKLWDLLKDPRDLAQDVPEDRFDLGRFYHKDGPHHGTTNHRMSYFLDDDVSKFDARFFGIAPGEAEAMDPQHRMLLEVVYETVDSSGLSIQQLSGSNTGVYVGIMCQDYVVLGAQDAQTIHPYTATGGAASNASSRISYFFNWHGPSMMLDTACSSAMVGVNEAVQALRSGSCRMAAACGTNLLLSPFYYITSSKLGMLSPTGRCHMWDKSADGYARGEGVACLMLKKLSDAIADCDTIEAVIREVGVNHDGKTRGLTMPSAKSQAALIRDTYARAGLDPTTKEGRCQFFEAHGTGTPAGDPQEAEALCRAFFPDSVGTESAEGDELLHVGSIKTVVGHTEGTAGIAGMIKAVMALQNSTIPPNLLFEKLNPTLKPFVRNLHIPTSPQPWPELPAGTPRRASVNSFGFGGVNAHVILETYTPEKINGANDTNGTNGTSVVESQNCPAPVVFSAATEKALVSVVDNMLATLEEREETLDFDDLAWTLATKRSALAQRMCVAATSVPHLREKLSSLLGSAKEGNNDAVKLGIPSLSVSPSILGVFTGQGAQWPTMGGELIKSIPSARNVLNALDASLNGLPSMHRPTWNLEEQLLADKKTSRLSEAALSQPLCTAVQIILVDLLRVAGVSFRAVVGHSSGEIGAAYAAGFLSATDAIRIAYYRGYFAKLAGGAAGEKGGMAAVGTSLDDAQELCMLEEFEGRLSVAAHNGPESVTLSGDKEAVDRAVDIFEEESKFARALRVDTAYHSAHMERCSTAYLAALKNCGIKLLKPADGAPLWFSSVHSDSRVMGLEGLDGKYWVDNMTKPVLFYPAVKAVVMREESLGINCAFEIGPHPALEQPAKASIEASNGRDIPYIGALRRGVNDAEIISEALGQLWALFGPSAVDLGQFQKSRLSGHKLHMVQDLPAYPWEHDRTLWSESRPSKLFRTQKGKFHDLLGLLTPESTAEAWRWRNILKTTEIKWMTGHKLQGQIVFPATGYIAMAMEAGIEMAGSRDVVGMDLINLEILKPISINESFGTEVVISMAGVKEDAGVITADYSVFSTFGKDASHLTLNCTATLSIEVKGNPKSRFGPRVAPVAKLTQVDVERFYQVLKDDYGYGYEGPFRSISKIQRRLNFASATIQNAGFEADATQLIFHPGVLDSVLQGISAAYMAPGDGRLWSIVAPTRINRVTLVPSVCGANMTNELEIDATVTDSREGGIVGDVEVYSAGYERRAIEIEGLHFSPFAGATAEDDRHMFQESIRSVFDADAALVFEQNAAEASVEAQRRKKGIDAERAAFYYLKTLHLGVDGGKRSTLPQYRQSLIDNAERLYKIVDSGSHPHVPKAWINDSHDDILRIMNSHGDTEVEFNLIRAVGEHIMLPDVLSGDTNILQYMTVDNYLDRYYQEGVGLETLNIIIAGVLGQLSNKYPRMKMLEIGAGTGGVTYPILNAVGNAYSSYMYTDISSGFFGRASERFASHGQKMAFKMLDIEKDPTSQGFTPYSYDVVIASNVLHATKSIKETLEHTRRLLRPGGYLILAEVIRGDALRHDLVMGSLAGWWVGIDDERTTGPSLTVNEWDAALKGNGFSGVESHSFIADIVTHPGSIMVSRSVNDNVAQLMKPLMAPISTDISKGSAMILGSHGSFAQTAAMQLCSVLEPHFNSVDYVSHIDDLPETLPNNLHIISLADCEDSFFKGVDPDRWAKFQRLLRSAASMVWLLCQSRDDNPYSGATLGLFRSVIWELPELYIQTLDLGMGVPVTSVKPNMLAQLLLRLKAWAQMTKHGEADSVLWNFEPELILEPDGRLYLPRVRQNVKQNDRYNSAKRAMSGVVDLEKSVVELVQRDDEAKTYLLRENHSIANAKRHADTVTIKVTCSLLSSLKTPAGYFFLQLGDDIESGGKALCFSSSNASVVTVPRSFTVPVNDEHGDMVDGQFMSMALARMMVQQVIDMLPPVGTVVAYEPNAVVASMLSRRLSKIGRKAVYITSRPFVPSASWISLHPHSMKRTIEAALPADVSLFVDASDGRSRRTATLESRITASLPPLCSKMAMSSLASSKASPLPATAPESVSSLIQELAAFAISLMDSLPDGVPLDILPAPRVAGSRPPQNLFSLVYWQLDQKVPVSVEPVSKREDLFRPDRTYWLAGLGGDLGRSLADYMFAHNAKHIVISSRNPLIDQGWLDKHQKQGNNMVYHSCDLTDFVSAKRTYDEISKTMPPIGGVANGAMVLRDGMVVDIGFDAVDVTLRSKVLSTLNLDQLFPASDETLDWFVGFSSIVATSGNPGQSAYSAGNMFMKTHMRQRRRAGLCGCTIDISRVAGLGFIERESAGRLTREHQARLEERSGTIAMGETDLHQMFAEAIVSGRPGSGLEPDIISGLAPIAVESVKSMDDIFWSSNPRLGLIIQQRGGGSAASGSMDGANAVPLGQLLAAAETPGEVKRMLLSGMKKKLQNLMFLADADGLSETTPLVDLGVDSLVGVHMRTWFQKELGVDVPVMTILGGASISDLVEGIAEQLPKNEKEKTNGAAKTNDTAK